MYFGLIILLCGLSNAVDDIFTDIPSQFSGYNYFVGLGFDSQAGQVEYKDYLLQGPSDPKIKVAIAHHSESGLWISGKTVFASIGGRKHTVYEKANLSTVTVEYPVSYGVSYRKGFLFSPSALCALNFSVGNEHVRYRAVAQPKEDSNLFVMGEVEIIVGLLTEWALEIGVGAATSDSTAVLLSTIDKYQPPQYLMTGKVGIVYRKDTGF